MSHSDPQEPVFALLADAASSEDVEVLAFRKPPEELPSSLQLPSVAAGLPPATATPPVAAVAPPPVVVAKPPVFTVTPPQPSVSPADQADEDR